MKCVFCGGKSAKRNVTFVYDNDAAECFVVENVPAEVCLQCGEKTYAPEAVDKLTDLTQRKSKPTRTIQMPVFDYAA
jgi:YgiT-type zinc finger domain-containing protein